MGQHLCYQRVVPLQEVCRYRYLFFDFECNQDSTSECSEGYAVGHCASCTDTPCIKCKKCVNCDDPACGSYTHRPNYVVCHKVCNNCVDRNILTKCDHCGDRCVDCNVLNDKGTSYANPPVSRLWLPTIIYSGSKIMYMSVGRGLDIRLLDSLNFLPMKLAALPKAFGLQELKKGWFPHFFNTKENQQYVGLFPRSSITDIT